MVSSLILVLRSARASTEKFRRSLRFWLLLPLLACAGCQTASVGTEEPPRTVTHGWMASERDGLSTGAVAIPVSVHPMKGRWAALLTEHADRFLALSCGYTVAREGCDERWWSEWQEIAQKGAATEGLARLQTVNAGVNRLLKYASDREIYGVSDHWATFREAVSRGYGDCEDSVIVKMWMLAAAGVDLSDMSIVVLKDLTRQNFHAVLMVDLPDSSYILDSTFSPVVKPALLDFYMPMYALGPSRMWIYGFVKAPLEAQAFDKPVS
jgi:predicted transglutaminase-like cysteine proteinase